MSKKYKITVKTTDLKEHVYHNCSYYTDGNYAVIFDEDEDEEWKAVFKFKEEIVFSVFMEPTEVDSADS